MVMELPAWAEEMRNLFKSGSVSQFLLNGNVFDMITTAGLTVPRLLSLSAFLDEVMFEQYEVILHYDRGKGIRATRGSQKTGANGCGLPSESRHPVLASCVNPGPAMELIDRYLLRSLNLQSLRGSEIHLTESL